MANPAGFLRQGPLGNSVGGPDHQVHRYVVKPVVSVCHDLHVGADNAEQNTAAARLGAAADFLELGHGLVQLFLRQPALNHVVTHHKVSFL